MENEAVALLDVVGTTLVDTVTHEGAPGALTCRWTEEPRSAGETATVYVVLRPLVALPGAAVQPTLARARLPSTGLYQLPAPLLVITRHCIGVADAVKGTATTPFGPDV